MLIRTPRNKASIAAIHDSIMAALSMVIALILRLGVERFSQTYFSYIGFILLFTVVCTAVSFHFRLYRRSWRYASLDDIVVIVKTAALSILIFLPLAFWFNRLEDMPRAVIIIEFLVLIACLSVPRFVYRMFREKSLVIDLTQDSSKGSIIPILLVGINEHSELFLREIKNRNSSLYQPVGIIDDDPGKSGQFIHGLKVYGNTHAIPKILAKLRKKNLFPQKIIITPEMFSGTEITRILRVSETLGLTLSRLPRLTDFKQHDIDSIEMRPIVIEDLLGRQQRALDNRPLESFIAGKHVLVTGAGGTIGSELVRQIASHSPSSLLLLENSEFNLYTIERTIRDSYPDLQIIPILCDIRDTGHLDQIFHTHTPHLVFHAAALKHVPMSEQNITETIYTNVIGTKNVADMCVKHHTTQMILISTDKAVNPTNVMGATKRLAEMYVQGLGKSSKSSQTYFSTIRFGNVLGSTGSVIPLFKEQIEKGGPLTVTDPKIKRYFMTVNEAVQLVLQATLLASHEDINHSQIFVLDMGEPVYINDLAEQMIQLAGLKPHIDINIEYTGLRPGEKLFEELFYGNETLLSTEQDGILLSHTTEQKLSDINKKINKLHDAIKHRSESQAIDLLQDAVAEFDPQN